MSPVVAVAQFAPGPDPDANLETIGRLTRDAVGLGAGLVVFPEYAQFFDRAPGPSWSPMAQPLDGTFVTALGELADATGATIVAGLVERAEELLKFHNTVVAIAPERGLVASYRKLHLYDAFGASESDWVEAGEILAPEIFEWDGLRVGLQTCYDIRFPEVTRRIVDAGADLVLVPAEWVAGPMKAHHWRTLITARALENTVYVAGADHIPPIGVGASLIVDPMGVALAALGEVESIATAVVDPGRIAAVREVNPSLRLRRFRVEAAD